MARKYRHLLLRGKQSRLLRQLVLWTAPLALWWRRGRIRRRVKRRIQPSVVVLATPDIQGSANVELGDEVLIDAGVYFETHGPGFISIGAGSQIGPSVLLISHARICIGANVVLGENVLLRDTEDAGGENGSALLRQAAAKPITIGDHVWVGAGSTILPGVSLAAGVVVGSNSVVISDVPPGLVVAGIPARPVGQTTSGHDGPATLLGAN